MTTKKVWLPDRRTDRRQTKWSLCAAMLRRRHKNTFVDAHENQGHKSSHRTSSYLQLYSLLLLYRVVEEKLRSVPNRGILLPPWQCSKPHWMFLQNKRNVMQEKQKYMYVHTDEDHSFSMFSIATLQQKNFPAVPGIINLSNWTIAECEF